VSTSVGFRTTKTSGAEARWVAGTETNVSNGVYTTPQQTIVNGDQGSRSQDGEPKKAPRKNKGVIAFFDGERSTSQVKGEKG